MAIPPGILVIKANRDIIYIQGCCMGQNQQLDQRGYYQSNPALFIPPHRKNFFDNQGLNWNPALS